MDDVLVGQADLHVFLLGNDLGPEGGGAQIQTEVISGEGEGNSGWTGEKTNTVAGGREGVGGRGGGGAHQHHDGLVERPGGLQGLLLLVQGVLPLQAVLDEHLGLGLFALGVQHKVAGDLVLHSCTDGVKKREERS